MQKKEDKRLIKLLATQLYMFTLKDKSGDLSLGKIEKKFKKKSFQSTEEYRENKSGAFYKYADKKSCIEDQILINRIEKDSIYKGSKYILNHPLWLILSTPEATVETTQEYMHKLSPDIQSRLFKLNKSTGEYERNFWLTQETFSRVSMLNNLDALTCFLLLMREMELLKKWHAYIHAKWYAHELFIRLSYFEPFSTISTDLYALIYKYFIAKNNPITSKHFPTKKQPIYEYFKKHYRSPYLLTNLETFHKVMRRVINETKELLSIGETKNEQLYFLFWVFEYNLSKVDVGLTQYKINSEQPIIIKNLISAYTSTNTHKYIRCSELVPFE